MQKSDSFHSHALFSRMARHVRLRQLQLLLALQQSGSIVKAAVHMDMSQSAATQALAELERVLDLKLFERHARGLRPTPAGQALIDSARGIMGELQDAADTLTAIRRGANAALRIGAIPSSARAILAPLLAQFYTKRPHVQVDVQEGVGGRLVSLLISGALDVVFCREPALLPDDFHFIPLLADEAVFITGPNHPLASARKIRLEQLTESRWVLPTSSIAVRAVFERVVLKQFPQTQCFPLSTLSLLVMEGLLAQPQAVTLAPRSITAGLQHGGTSAMCVLDMLVDRDSLALAPLGAVCKRDATPALLAELLQLWFASAPAPG